MKHKYELRAWHDDDTMTTVLKINAEPKDAKRRAKSYANEITEIKKISDKDE
jgi:hypothetical protein